MYMCICNKKNKLKFSLYWLDEYCIFNNNYKIHELQRVNEYKSFQKSYTPNIKMSNKKLYLLIGTLLLVLNIQAQLLAIDFGTQFIKASIVHSGAGKTFSIVENSKSERKFLSALGFFNQERFYQSDALPKRTKVPENCFLYSRMLIDFVNNPNLVSTIKKDLFLQYINQNNENQLMAQFVLKNFPSQTSELTLLEVITMILKYVKTEAEKFAKITIKDVVLVLPNYWSIHQRNFLLQAAAIADIYVLSIVSQNTAASINYALTQRTNNKTQNVLFYNVGSNSLQMTLAEYRQVASQSSAKPVESIFIKDDYGKPYVGGLRLDSIISKYFQQIFEEKHKRKLDKKGLIKLLGECNKVKETLSSNKQATVFVEGIMDGIDFQAKMSRAQFQHRAEQVFKQLTSPLKRFLLDNDLKAQDLHSVELIGGGTRIPKLQSMITEILNDQKNIVGTHINGDESMALGGAFFAANSSKKFKVKGINLYDGFNFDVRLVLRNLEEDIKQGSKNYFYKNATIFKKKSRYGLTKQVSFKSQVNLIADLYRVDTETQQQQLLKSYELDKVKDFNQSDFKLSLIFTIDPLQVVYLKESKFAYKREQIQTYLQKVKKLRVRNATNIDDYKTQTAQNNEENIQENSNQESTSSEQSLNEKNRSEQGKKQDQSLDQSSESEQKENGSKWDQQQQSESQDESQQSKDLSDDQKSGANKSETTQKNKKKPKKTQPKYEYETVQRNKTVIKKLQKDLRSKLKFNVKNIEENLNQRTKKMLTNYQKAEERKRTLAEVRNKLEAIIYQTKDKVQNEEFITYSKESERQHLKKLAQQKQQWHDQSTSKNPEDYRREFSQLHKPLDKVKKRMIEHSQRQHIRDRALKIVKQHSSLSESVKKGKQWITDEEVEELKGAFSEAVKKIKNIYKSMQETPLNQDPTFLNKDMIKEAEDVKDKYFALKAKPKPTKKEEKKQEAESQQQSEETQQKDDEKQSKVEEDEL